MKSRFLQNVSLKIRHYFHVVSNVRPLVWICLYIILVPVFAVVYWLMPDGMFRVPDGGFTDFGSWLYYSIVTISTLGFGDYTPMHGFSEAVTAIEVMCGVIILGLFLNAVGAMKSEIDVESEIEKQRRLNEAAQKSRLQMRASAVLRVLHSFVNHCKDATSASVQNRKEAVSELMKSASRTALALDSLQAHVDLSLWPDLLENSFAFVANYQLLTSEIGLKATELTAEGEIGSDLQAFITSNSKIASDLEEALTKDALPA